MTFGAVDFGMFSFKGITCEFGVIELFLIDSNGIEVAAFVFTVALHAVFIGKTMEPAFLSDEGTNGLVAVQTFFVGDSFSGIMAFQAVFVLKILMSFDEGARG